MIAIFLSQIYLIRSIDWKVISEILNFLHETKRNGCR